jgi:anti-sigma factor RsiW
MSCISPESRPDWKAYTLGDLNPEVSRQAEAHLAACSHCHEEVATLRLTLDTLSTLREEEVPRRIAFVSDKVFEPRWWQRVFNPTFAAGALVAAAILIHGSLRPGQAQVDAAVSTAVNKAVAQVEAQHAQDSQIIQAMSDLIEHRDKQIGNMVLTNAALIR